MSSDQRRVQPPRRRQYWGVEEPDAEPEVTLGEVGPAEVLDRRRLLWRDSATILMGVVVALLVFQLLGPTPGGPLSSSESDFPSAVAIGSVGPPATLAPGVTVGPILDPSLAIDASPTPIPVITPGPTPTAGPTPTPPPPFTAAFTWHQGAGTRSVKFTDTSTGIVVTRLWTFGDGMTATGPTPSHTYPSTGSYVVRLEVTFSTGASSATAATVKVTTTPPTPPPTGPPPTPEVTPQPTAAPPSAAFAWVQTDPLTISFTNTSSGEASWTWDFGDGDGSTAQSPNHVYALAGDYTVRLTVSGPGGTDFVEHTVHVELIWPPPP